MEAPAPSDEQQRNDSPAEDHVVGVVYKAVTKGYDKGPLGYPEEKGVKQEITVRPCGSRREGVLWNRKMKIIGAPQRGDWSLYLDGSINPKAGIRGLVEGWLKDADMALLKHPHRTCVYAEIDACVTQKKITAEEGEKSRAFLILSGFPRNFGLWACGVIARKRVSTLPHLMVSTIWWDMVQNTPRDQIWLPYALWRVKDSEKRIKTVDADIFNNPWFSYRRHGS